MTGFGIGLIALVFTVGFVAGVGLLLTIGCMNEIRAIKKIQQRVNHTLQLIIGIQATHSEALKQHQDAIAAAKQPLNAEELKSWARNLIHASLHEKLN